MGRGFWLVLFQYKAPLLFSSFSSHRSHKSYHQEKKKEVTKRESINSTFYFACSVASKLDLLSSIGAMGMAAESQFHVLAVDDSLIDRKLIEKLLKISSFQGTFLVAKHGKEILNISVQTLYSWVVVVSFAYVILSCFLILVYSVFFNGSYHS